MDDSNRPRSQHRQNSVSSNSSGNINNNVSTKKSLESFVGKQIKIKTASNEEIEGSIYAYDSITNCIALVPNPERSKNGHSFRIIKTSYIKEIISVGQPQRVNKKDVSVGYIDLEKLKVRESDAIKDFGTLISNVGVGVTKDGQQIFNALSKTLPCRWSKETIVVMDEIFIAPPYSINDCKAKPTSAAYLDRIKNVLEMERKKLQN